MTQKKQQILQSALELFAREGYQNTPTSKIACKADVSEGLIFKHFKNKEGLLIAVINLMNEELGDFIKEVKKQNDPKDVIRMAFEFPPLVTDNKDFWKLQFSLRYQCPEKKQYHQKKEFTAFMKKMLIEAFTELDYKQPEMEAIFLMNTIHDLCKANAEDGCDEKYINFVKKKYDLQAAHV